MEDNYDHLQIPESRIEEVVVSSDEFAGIINSEKFSKALALASKTTKKTSRETGFSVRIDNNNKVFIGEITAGAFDEISNEVDTQIISKMDTNEIDMDWEQNICSTPLLNFHFHPDSEGAVIPSNADISNFLREESQASIGVGHVLKDGSVDLLIVKPKNYPLYRDLLEEYADQFAHRPTQAEIIQGLEKAGLSSIVVHFTNKNGKLSLDPESAKKINELGKLKFSKDSFLF
ncbi:MAG: hypothetical protein COX79_04550 [Candidatus Levybacteria bacterium CG_4_10_14_0_2_um_filter_36_16]|nr:MAG: hypothetical protein AUK12_03055 [Candidatus Levybacteria bacterium CG2_30_37_29]PIR79505.1 MAG: hypothetical protein COU26_00745 [Candidatus Levybacteria bacterium CG10_big_fil_rev_8_21_14_0_10_36_30]PIZ96704.1 MAG: hypothetical protein COX79_04550 [Candidatus Levybacteria bacterium CG_4_10_14_0_2_um_filter_36_16]